MSDRSLHSVSAVSKHDGKKRVVVVGAGLAGLTVAYRLMQSGYDVAVYEARLRVGGRVFSIVMQDNNGKQHVAELGGQDILAAQDISSGCDAGHIRALITEFGLKVNEVSYPMSSMGYFDGANLTFPEPSFKEYGFTAETLWDHLTALSKQATNMDDVLRALFQDNDLLYRSFTVKLSCYEGADTHKLSPIYTGTLYKMLTRILSDKPEETTIGSTLSLAGGNAQLAEVLAQKLGSRVHLNHVFTGITKDAAGIFTLQFGNGESVQADIVISTVPCPIYQSISFGEGVIPEDQLKAIRNVGYGGTAKILVPVAEGESSCLNANDRVIAWKAAPEDPVTLYYREPYGDFTQETLKKTVMQDIPVVSLGHTLQKTKQEFCVAKDEACAVYQGIVGHSWVNDPFAKGSYCHIAAGQEELCRGQGTYAGEPMRTLFAPAGNLFFAGEHTTVLLDFFGTMEAAVESGERVARIIASLHKP